MAFEERERVRLLVVVYDVNLKEVETELNRVFQFDLYVLVCTDQVHNQFANIAAYTHQVLKRLDWFRD